MKKTYGLSRRNQKPRPRIKQAKHAGSSSMLVWAAKFLQENCNYDSASVLEVFQGLPSGRRKTVERSALRVLADGQLRRNENLRNGAVRLIIALLPSTFPLLEKLLSDVSSPSWYEAHFVAFNSLERSNLSEPDQKRVLTLVEHYLMNVKSDAGFAAWKAGDMLGDEWYAPETLQILERVVTSARYVAGRNGALHGIQHALDELAPSERERVLALVRKVASEDPSGEVRRYANYTLTSGGCFHQVPAPPTADSRTQGDSTL